MQIDRNALNRILAALGLNPQNIAGVRAALSGATESDIQKLDALYADYRRNRRQR